MTYISCDPFQTHTKIVVKVSQPSLPISDRNALSERLSWFANLRQENLVAVRESGLTEDGEIYSVREYIEGHNLLDLPASLWAPQVVSLLHFLRHCRQVHGGIRPSNLLRRSDNTVALMDPWLCPSQRAPMDEEDVHFTSPEILGGSEPTFEADLYALGILLFRGFAGSYPFTDPDLDNLIFKYLYAQPPSLSGTASVSHNVAEGIRGLLEKNPSNRVLGFETLIRLWPDQTFATGGPFVGRRLEIQNTLSLCPLQHSSSLRTVCFEGPIGIGKTRLLQEIDLRAKFCGTECIYVDAKRGDVGQFAAALEKLMLLRERHGGRSIEDQLGSIAAPFLQITSGGDNCVPAKPAHRAQLLASSIAMLARQRPFILQIDGAEPAATTLVPELIEQLCYRADETPLLLLVAFRTLAGLQSISLIMQEFLKERLTFFRLERLTADESQVLTLSFTDLQEIRRNAAERSGGNPRLLQEHLRSNNYEAGGFFETVSTSLDETTKRVLQACAILHPHASVETAKHVSGCEGNDFAEALKCLIAHLLLSRTGDDLHFTYADLPQFVISRLKRPKRRELHRAAYFAVAPGRMSAVAAIHAFQGGLFEQSLGLYIKLMRTHSENGNYSAAIFCYESAKRSADGLPEKLSVDDRLRIARCYAVHGQRRKAARICEELLQEEFVLRDVHLLSRVYATQAQNSINGCDDQIKFYKKAIEAAPSDATNLPELYALLSQSLCMGDSIREAELMIERAEALVEQSRSSKKISFVSTARNHLQLHKGEFAELLETVNPSRTHTLINRGVALNYIAIALEHLGQLRKAAMLQRHAAAVAANYGYPLGEIISTANLGIFATKLGDFASASIYFSQAQDLFVRYARTNTVLNNVSAYIDAATFYQEAGKYSEALTLYKKASKHANAAPHRERVSLAMTGAELFIRLEAHKGAAALLTRFKDSEVFKTTFFQVESILARARSGQAIAEELYSAIEHTNQMGTV